MQYILQLTDKCTPYIIIILLVLNLILISTLVLNYIKIRKLQQQYNKFMNRDDLDLQSLLEQYALRMKEIEDHEQTSKNNIEEINSRLKKVVQKVGAIRYTAIEHVGPDLSFAIALLDELNNGFVLNGIYGRTGSYTYAKPIKEGISKYMLSEEEKEAIQIAINQQI
ncbi:hypothetical protein AN639_06130 [Candidatus Epulonipiscium fishelsonii]|uniref:Uncharacterized protein n=1 Tax=Candidatus Epulonipiscium fishelsonii TaxID=77094 RepID=A0ACC8XEU0_9FIRM|nr:hypothetical protein AN639_06130 [Epulopiscium sp. SCG-B05WGA-EpuloA1]ONI41697.1 hypothetical protein AN396_03270 [Epulopiscium sp. SCG-B11WGA-EpuloA1]